VDRGRAPLPPAVAGGVRAPLQRARRRAADDLLTGWRIALAADLLREPAATLGAIADQVGYGGPFALSTALKRVRGVSPQQYRAARS
jgi:AraC-like DNA-binding protein